MNKITFGNKTYLLAARRVGRLYRPSWYDCQRQVWLNRAPNYVHPDAALLAAADFAAGYHATSNLIRVCCLSY